MKNLILALLAAVLWPLHPSASAAQSQAAPHAELTVSHHRLKTFPRSRPVRRVRFRLRNTGTAPLLLYGYVPSCNCISARFSSRPVAPGDTASIIVVYDATGTQPGYFHRQVTVNSNSSPHRALLLSVEGEMTE